MSNPYWCQRKMYVFWVLFWRNHRHWNEWCYFGINEVCFRVWRRNLSCLVRKKIINCRLLIICKFMLVFCVILINSTIWFLALWDCKEAKRQFSRTEYQGYLICKLCRLIWKNCWTDLLWPFTLWDELAFSNYFFLY